MTAPTTALPPVTVVRYPEYDTPKDWCFRVHTPTGDSLCTLSADFAILLGPTLAEAEARACTMLADEFAREPDSPAERPGYRVWWWTWRVAALVAAASLIALLIVLAVRAHR